MLDTPYNSTTALVTKTKVTKAIATKLLALTSMIVTSALMIFSVTAVAQNDENQAGAKPKDHQTIERASSRHHRGPMRDLLKMVDNNGDGKVDLNEFLSNAETRFNEMDLDGDQYVTPEEAKQAHRKMRAKHRKLRKEKRKHHRRLHQDEQVEDKQVSDQD